MPGDDRLEALLRQGRAEHFAPGFAARVLRRARQLEPRSLDAVLQRYFLWLVPAAVAMIAFLAFHNARSAGATRRGIDAVLALPSVTLDAAYTFDASSSAP